MSANNIKEVMDTTMEKLRAMVDADTIIGSPITVDDITILPVCKISFGVATGGSDFPSKTQREIFGGGGGAGVSINPIAFMVVNKGEIKMMQIYNDATSIDKAITMAPELLDKVKELFKK